MYTCDTVHLLMNSICKVECYHWNQGYLIPASESISLLPGIGFAQIIVKCCFTFSVLISDGTVPKILSRCPIKRHWTVSIRHCQAWDEDSPLVLEVEDEDFQSYEDEDKDEDSVLQLSLRTRTRTN